jgi:hypothetical protein
VSKVLRTLNDDTEDLGHQPGTPEFDKALCALKVHRCKEMHSVHECSECPAFEHCDLVREYLLDLKFPNRRNPG